VLVAALIMILVGWALSPSAIRARSWLNARLEAGRNGLDEIGVTMGKAGQIMGSQVTPIRWVIVLLGVLAIVFSTPHTSALIITWTLVTLLALTAFELLWRKPAAARRAAPAKPAAAKAVAKKPTTKKPATRKPAAKK
jgi:hypothetical protein